MKIPFSASRARGRPAAGLAYAAPGPEATAQGREFFGHGEGEFYAIADALGARSLNAVALTRRRFETDGLAEAFGALCDRAGRHGLLVHLEFLPWTQIRDVRDAAEIVRRAGRPNGGIMLDSWHHFRSGAPDAAIPAALVTGIQINDAPARAEPDLVAETSHRRLVPGEGDIDLPALLAHLSAGGCRAPIGVEIYSDALAARPARETALRVAAACRRVLRPARAPAS